MIIQDLRDAAQKLVKLELMVGPGKQEEETEGGSLWGLVERQWSLLVQVIPSSFSSEINVLFNNIVLLMHELAPFLKTDPSDQNICLSDLLARSCLFIWDHLICR